MDEYKKWLKESKYVTIIKVEKDDTTSSVLKSNTCKYESPTGYYGEYSPITGLHIRYINVRKCSFMTNLLKEAYMFDAYNFSRRCRKEKLNKIEECQKYSS